MSGKLSIREREILKLVAKGMTNKEIAGRLKIARSTVANHLSIIYKKLNVGNRVEAARIYLEELNKTEQTSGN